MDGRGREDHPAGREHGKLWMGGKTPRVFLTFLASPDIQLTAGRFQLGIPGHARPTAHYRTPHC